MSLELQKRKKLLVSTFTKALCLTLALHIVGFALFKVKLGSSPASDTLQPIKIVAQADIQEFFPTSSAPSAKQNLSSSFSTPKAPLIPQPNKNTQATWFQAPLPPVNFTPSPVQSVKHNNLWVFEQLEHIPYQTQNTLNLSYGSSYKPIKIEVFDPLNQLKAVNIPYQDESHYYPKFAKTLPYLFTFNIKVENKTGKIFWIAPIKENTKELSSIIKLKRLAQNIAKQVEFKRQKKDRGITEATLEVLFEIEEGKTLPKNLIVSK